MIVWRFINHVVQNVSNSVIMKFIIHGNVKVADIQQ